MEREAGRPAAAGVVGVFEHPGTDPKTRLDERTAANDVCCRPRYYAMRTAALAVLIAMMAWGGREMVTRSRKRRPSGGQPGEGQSGQGSGDIVDELGAQPEVSGSVSCTTGFRRRKTLDEAR